MKTKALYDKDVMAIVPTSDGYEQGVTGGDGVDDEAIGEEAMIHADAAIARWIEQGNYRNVGLKMPDVAGQMDLPYYLLRSWLRRQNLKFSDWMAGLRVEEAKRTIEAHPDWQNEAVAEHCGFTERTLLRTFKKLTGMTPTQYAAQSHEATRH